MDSIPHSFPTEVKPTAAQLEVEELHRLASDLFSCEHPEKWRNDVARELNVILGRVTYALEVDGDESDVYFARAALSIAQRVADFEEINRA